MVKPDISIIIVNYNVKDFLFNCLKSIDKASGGLSVETIVVDNDSKDGSIESLKPVFPNVNFIELKENIGFGRANNLGIEKARAEYLLILNPDTVISHDTLHVMKDFLDNNTDAGVAGCKVLNDDGSFQLACRRGFPTPWASFSKLFGLQKLFPASPLFARYNQTYKSIDDTYEVDAVIGAFMFCRKEAITEAGPFDKDFFMYGEDIDLCYRIKQKGWKIYYVHTTSIIHFKGESTKRSSINEVKHFYQAMEIFAKKHYGKSYLFLLFLRLGILIRSIIAYTNKQKRDLFFIIFDSIAISFAVVLGTKLRFDEFFGFPDYAYPTVFIAVIFILFTSMFFVGEYFEGKPSIKRAFTGYLISFFLLSSLTYFFNNYAFSRAIILFTIGFGGFLSLSARILLALIEKTAGSDSEKRIAIVGTDEDAKKIIHSFETNGTSNINVVGFISAKKINEVAIDNIPVIGNIDYLKNIVEDYNIKNLIITDKKLSQTEIINLMSQTAGKSVKYYVANEFEEFIASQAINDIAGKTPNLPDYNISQPRLRFIKRALDILISIILLTIGLPFIYLSSKNSPLYLKKLVKVLKGKLSFIGLYPVGNKKYHLGKEGIAGLAHISKPERLTEHTIDKLNDYYLRNYSLSLDIEIFLKLLSRNKRG